MYICMSETDPIYCEQEHNTRDQIAELKSIAVIDAELFHLELQRGETKTQFFNNSGYS